MGYSGHCDAAEQPPPVGGWQSANSPVRSGEGTATQKVCPSTLKSVFATALGEKKLGEAIQVLPGIFCRTAGPQHWEASSVPLVTAGSSSARTVALARAPVPEDLVCVFNVRGANL